jgi:hypothetical protein
MLYKNKNNVAQTILPVREELLREELFKEGRIVFGKNGPGKNYSCEELSRKNCLGKNIWKELTIIQFKMAQPATVLYFRVLHRYLSTDFNI